MKGKQLICTVLITGLLCSARILGFADSQSFGNLTLVEISPRVITPNSDLRNDKVFFRFGEDSLVGIPIDANVYDLSGAKINSLRLDLSGTALSWDGTDNAGRLVPSGIYLYQIKIGQNAASGTVVVAK